MGVVLLHSLIEHWEVRGFPGLARVDPHNIDAGAVIAQLDKMRDPVWKEPALLSLLTEGEGDRMAPAEPDDFAACGAHSSNDIEELFAPRFWFGCEADDPGAAWALKPPHCLSAMFGSDIGHFDVPDMLSVLPAAWSLVEKGQMTEDEFGDYCFRNVVRLHGTMNPAFFDGTTVEGTAHRVLRAAQLVDGSRPVDPPIR